MTEIVLCADTVSYTSREPDPTDEWDSGDTYGYVSDVRAWVARDFERGKHLRWGGGWSGELDVQPGGVVFAVVADYESGSTFGRDGGYAQVVDVFTDIDQAGALARAAEKVSNLGDFEYDGKKYYANWIGYFESLQAMKVWPVIVKDYANA